MHWWMSRGGIGLVGGHQFFSENISNYILGCYYTDKKSEMEYRFNISSGDLLSMTSNRDGSYIRLHFDTDHMISEVQHSSGAFMIISYDEIGRISKATLKNSTYGADQMA